MKNDAAQSVGRIFGRLACEDAAYGLDGRPHALGKRPARALAHERRAAELCLEIAPRDSGRRPCACGRGREVESAEEEVGRRAERRQRRGPL